MFDLVVLSLITWRITSLLVREPGPGDLLARFRHAAGVRYDSASQPTGVSLPGQILACVWCCSIWVGWGVAIFADWRSAPWMGLAYSAIAVIINRWVK